jgi:hypothetical protein
MFVLPVFVCPTVCAQELPREISVCELARDPKSFDGKTVQVRGTLSVDFEDFSLDSNCNEHQGIWLAFGGDVPGIVPSTVNDNFRKRGPNLRVKGVSYGIQKDEPFRKLYALIAARKGDTPAYSATATLSGVFFAGDKLRLPNGEVQFGGYGHLGCCSLFVITRVVDVDSVPPADLAIRGTVFQPDGRPAVGFVVINDILGGTPPQRQQTATNDKGAFEFSNSGQVLRFENPKYRPVMLMLESLASPVDVKLEPAQQSDRVVRGCDEKDRREKRLGFSVLFTIPTTMKYERSNSGLDQWYSVFPHGKEAYAADLIISPNADGAAKHTSSVGYGQTEQRWLTDSTGAIIGIESWGHEKDRSSWRNALFWTGDNARYDHESGNEVGVLDRIIESGCLTKR